MELDKEQDVLPLETQIKLKTKRRLSVDQYFTIINIEWY